MTHFRQLSDHELQFLEEFVEVVDHRLDRIEDEIAKHHDPDGYGLLDTWESTSRIGFVLCQNYLYDVIGRRAGRDRQRCFDLGPLHAKGVSYAAIINAAGNFVKHNQEAEPHLGSRFQPDCTYRLPRRIIRRSVNFRVARYPLDALFSRAWRASLIVRHGDLSPT